MPPSAHEKISQERSSTPAKDTFGCLTGRLETDQSLVANGIKIYRKVLDVQQLLHVETEPSERGMLLGVSMRSGHNRRILGDHASHQEFEKGSVYLRNFEDRYRAEIRSPFDFVLVEMSNASLARAREEKEGQRVGGLSLIASAKDEVLFNLARALTPALADPSEACELFIDQVSLALTIHLVETYCGSTATVPRTNRILSPSYEARAKEMMRSKMDGSISISEIAQACGLSRSYFIYAFRETIGQTPHQWLIAQRLEHARTLLMNSDMRLADVAAACGFADQSHFTRAFNRHLGVSPGTLRRKAKGSSPCSVE